MPHPLLLEINTRCWLQELSAAHGRSITLANLPESICSDWARMGVTHVWLMGVWTTGAFSCELARSNNHLKQVYDEVLPDWTDEDVLGSPYAVESYTVPARLGGMDGLKRARETLRHHGLKLVLDFVPNHVGLDHPWVMEHPGRFVQASPRQEHAFQPPHDAASHWLAHGRDPYFPGWTDTVQLDYRLEEVHQVMRSELLRLSGFCDGVRCDMAMLMLSDVFQNTWKSFPATRPAEDLAVEDFWERAIQQVREVRPEFLFLAEVYWDMEARLQDLGFDFTYDKVLADALCERRGADAIQRLKQADPEFVSRCAHFLENHDERRVAGCLGVEEHRAAAAVILALPGMRFLHDGQTEGARYRTPVQLGRRRAEARDEAVAGFYLELLAAFGSAGVGQGTGQVLPVRPAWSDNPTAQDVLVVQWGDFQGQCRLVVVNLGSSQSQCRVPLAVEPAGIAMWFMRDLLGDERWERCSQELQEPGLFLDLPPFAVRLFAFEPRPAST